MTGTGAISNGVRAFKAPESLNARKTLIWMGVLLATMFMGLSYLGVQPGVTDDAASAQRLALEWEEWAPGVELLIVTNVPYHMASKAGT
ncbi:MAG: hypothetical protein JOZ65_05830 [Chloroflexi bacterium]|nr:hypothetical protein [Chloroflexota bacterium]